MEHLRLYARNFCNSKHVKLTSESISQFTRDNPRSLLYGSLFILTVVWIAVTTVRRLRSESEPSRSRTPDLEKPQYARQTSNTKSKFAMEEPGGKYFSPHL
jgi:hypothetical protein